MSVLSNELSNRMLFDVFVDFDALTAAVESLCKWIIEEPGVMKGCIAALTREILVNAGVVAFLDLSSSPSDDPPISSQTAACMAVPRVAVTASNTATVVAKW